MVSDSSNRALKLTWRHPSAGHHFKEVFTWVICTRIDENQMAAAGLGLLWLNLKESEAVGWSLCHLQQVKVSKRLREGFQSSGFNLRCGLDFSWEGFLKNSMWLRYDRIAGKGSWKLPGVCVCHCQSASLTNCIYYYIAVVVVYWL